LCLFQLGTLFFSLLQINMELPALNADYVDLTAVQGELEVGPPSPYTASPITGQAELAVALAANPAVTAALSRDPSLGATATACLAAAKAAGTVRGYSGTLRRYNAFCSLAGLEPLSFTEDVLIQFILHLDQREAGYHLLASVKPALVYLSSTLGVPPGFSPAVDLLLAGAKRRARAAAGPARKAPALSPEDLAAVLSRVFPPHDKVGLAEAAHMRMAFRLVVEYHTLCRLACFRQLRACHFELAGDDIVVTFPSAKNDQLHLGRSSCLVASGSDFCPVRITKLYFQRFGLRFGLAAGDKSFINFRIRREASRVLPIRDKSLSASQATTDLRTLLTAAGVACPGATDKSVKMSGVTAAFAAGASSEEVMHIGRWQTPHIPLRYKHNSAEFKRSVAALIPPVAGAGATD
jgi:hypothetical protein